jgi:hypothetical protein
MLRVRLCGGDSDSIRRRAEQGQQDESFVIQQQTLRRWPASAQFLFFEVLFL